jgi:hypothetical protein
MLVLVVASAAAAMAGGQRVVQVGFNQVDAPELSVFWDRVWVLVALLIRLRLRLLWHEGRMYRLRGAF